MAGFYFKEPSGQATAGPIGPKYHSSARNQKAG